MKHRESPSCIDALMFYTHVSIIKLEETLIHKDGTSLLGLLKLHTNKLLTQMRPEVLCRLETFQVSLMAFYAVVA